MQLNPARGRKQDVHIFFQLPISLGLCSSTPRGDGNLDIDDYGETREVKAVYAAQPREGTETAESLLAVGKASRRFMQLNPARGRKLDRHEYEYKSNSRVYAAQPREGTETIAYRHSMPALK